MEKLVLKLMKWTNFVYIPNVTPSIKNNNVAKQCDSFWHINDANFICPEIFRPEYLTASKMNRIFHFPIHALLL